MPEGAGAPAEAARISRIPYNALNPNARFGSVALERPRR
jgi:hypothetical protein